MLVFGRALNITTSYVLFFARSAMVGAAIVLADYIFVLNESG